MNEGFDDEERPKNELALCDPDRSHDERQFDRGRVVGDSPNRITLTLTGKFNMKYPLWSVIIG